MVKANHYILFPGSQHGLLLCYSPNMNPFFRKFPTLLFILLFLAINVATKYIEPRVDSCSNNDDEVATNEEAVQDGPTSDQSAGLGIEFEAGDLEFSSKTCQNKDKQFTDNLKGKCWKCWKHSLLALHQSGKLGHVTQL